MHAKGPPTVKKRTMHRARTRPLEAWCRIRLLTQKTNLSIPYLTR